MFRRLTIRNFRSIESATVDLGGFTVVVGPNGSGKSNFVDALVFLRDIGNDAESAVASRGGIGSVVRWSKTRPYDLRLELLIAASPDLVDKEHFQHSMVIRCGKDGAWRFHEERTEVHSKERLVSHIDRSPGGAMAEGAKSKWHADLSQQASALMAARQFAFIEPKFLRSLLGIRRYRLSPDEMRRPQKASDSDVLQENGANIATVVRKLREQGDLDGAIDTMRRVIPGLRDIRTVAAGGFEVLEFQQAQAGGSAEFSASDMSEGSLRALGVVLAAHQMPKGEMLVIEEPEANVHPGAAALIYDVLELASARCDVLITTHSPDLLDAAKDETILVCSYASGVTRIGPLASAQKQLVREGLFRLADLMRAEPLRIEGDTPETVDP